MYESLPNKENVGLYTHYSVDNFILTPIEGHAKISNLNYNEPSTTIIVTHNSFHDISSLTLTGPKVK